MSLIYKHRMLIVNILMLLLCINIGKHACAKDTDNTFPTAEFSDLKRTMHAKVTDVLSPITIKLDNEKTVQLMGLDIPDLDYYEPGPYAVTAQKILKDFLVGQSVDVYQIIDRKGQHANRMGYELAHVARSDNDGWAQGLLLQLGLARIRTTPNTAFMVDQMREREISARTLKNGLWADPNYKILNTEEAKAHIGSFQVVEGTVKNVSIYKNEIYLNFGNNWREDFTIAISAFDEKKFLNKDIDLQQWNGKRLRVRGWLESYNGPFMKLDHPARFEEIKPEHTIQKTNNVKTQDPKAQSPTILQKGNALPGYNQ